MEGNNWLKFNTAYLPELWLYLLPSLCPSLVHRVLYTHMDRCQNKYYCNATISEMLWCHTHKQSNEQGLYTCTPAASMFVCFPWRCTTRPWRAVKVTLAARHWKCVRGGRLRGPAWNLQSPHRGRGPAPSRATSRAEGRTEREPTGNPASISVVESQRYRFTWRHVSTRAEHTTLSCSRCRTKI